MRLDNYLIEKTDKLMIWAQKHHAVNLATTKFGLWIAIWIMAVGQYVVSGSPIGAAVCFIFWGIIVTIEWRNWKNDRHYYENHRKVLSLNAEVLFMREIASPIRIFSVFFASALAITEVGAMYLGKFGVSDALSFLVFFGITIQGYLVTATFLGPGEFAKEKKEVLSGDLATNRL